MELFYVYGVKCAKRFTVALFLVSEAHLYEYSTCFDNTHAPFL